MALTAHQIKSHLIRGYSRLSIILSQQSIAFLPYPFLSLAVTYLPAKLDIIFSELLVMQLYLAHCYSLSSLFSQFLEEFPFLQALVKKALQRSFSKPIQKFIETYTFNRYLVRSCDVSGPVSSKGKREDYLWPLMELTFY